MTPSLHTTAAPPTRFPGEPSQTPSPGSQNIRRPDGQTTRPPQESFHTTLSRHVIHDSPPTHKAFSISGQIPSILVPLWSCLTTSVSSTTPTHTQSHEGTFATSVTSKLHMFQLSVRVINCASSQCVRDSIDTFLSLYRETESWV